MALEAVIFLQDTFSCTLNEMYNFEEANSWGWDIPCQSPSFYANWEASSSPSYPLHGFEDCNLMNHSIQPSMLGLEGASTTMADNVTTRPSLSSNGRKKRRRTKSMKNKEEVESQRMTHIAVERNRRKQMNDYLALLRSLMPPSYSQKGDQASIIGGAINYVKELEQLLQSLEISKQLKQDAENRANVSPLASTFAFPQYSLTHYAAGNASLVKPSAVADIEVTMVESHASLKLLCRRRPKQLLQLVVGIHSLRLTALHLNVSSFDSMILYSFNLKVEEECELSSGDDIAAAVHDLVWKIHEEDGFDG